MKTRISAGLVVLVVALAALAAVAFAASSHGKISAFSYKASTKSGRLAVVKSGNKTIYHVNSSTNCGVSFGQSGDQIPCRSLGKSKYDGKPVHVVWTKHGSAKVASLVAVDLSK